jgi:uncharacterized protein YutE (UPF0331/DUF86 family)
MADFRHLKREEARERAVFRPEPVRALLLRLETVIAGLAKLAASGSSGPLDDEIQLWPAERGLQLGAEILFQIGNQILATGYGMTPDTYEKILDELTSKQVLKPELRKRLQGLGGFRNLLVHDYLKIDPERVLETLSHGPRDFGDFAVAIQDWLDRGGVK